MYSGAEMPSVAPSASPDFQVATPTGAQVSGYYAQQADQKFMTPVINSDRNTQQSFLDSEFKGQQLPQLQSNIASAGQAYGTANLKAQGNAYEGFKHSTYDIQSAANRQLDDLTRQRIYASMGLVI